MPSTSSFFSRFSIGLSAFRRVLADPVFAQHTATSLRASAALPAAQPTPALTSTPAPAKAAALPLEQTHASALALLALLQREGRLVDFLQEDVSAYADAEIGAAVRVVHAGSRKVLADYFTLAPAWPGAEGDPVTLPVGFDAQRIRLVGNVAGQPPYRGALKHHGWVATTVRLPDLSPALDPRVIAPAEVEL